MRKAFLLVALAAATLVGCNQKENSRQEKRDRHEQVEGHHRMSPEEQQQKKAEMEAKKAEREAKINEAWEKFNQLSDAEKNEWIEESKKNIDRRDSIQKAKQAEMEAKWATFDKATMEEKVELLKMRGVTYREHTHREMPQHQPGKHVHDENCNHKHDGKGPKYPIQELKRDKK